MKRKVYVTDLDGTLLRSDQSISDFTSNIFTKLLNHNIIITYATARGYISSTRVTHGIPWKYPLILYNGALIYDGMHSKVIDGFWLNNHDTNEVIAIGRKHNITPLFFSLDLNDHERVLHEKLQRLGEISFVLSRKDDPRFMEVLCLECPPDHRTLSLTYIGLIEELEPIFQEVTERLGSKVHSHMMKDYYIDNHYFLEFSHPNANKRDGLKLWAQHMNIDMEDTVVFGDNLNDLGLFEIGGTKVAVQNAHETILKLADTIIKGNNEDGVAEYLAKAEIEDFNIKVIDLDATDITDLLNESLAEGHRHISRMLEDYLSGKNRFSEEGEVLLGAFAGEQIIGICGLNIDPYQNNKSIGRIRRLYVLKEYRRHGFVKRLMEKVIQKAKGHFAVIVLKTDNPAADKFYRVLGFSDQLKDSNSTHQMVLKR